MGLAKYFKSAFMNRWNLLAFFAGSGVAALSGIPEVIFPLVFAAEFGYVSLLGAHPKYQAYVDAQAAKRLRESGSQANSQMLQQILRTLPKPALKRFEELRARCLELRQIAMDLKQSDQLGSSEPLESFQLAGLDKLLWIFLRLLFTQFSLAKFLERTSIEQIQRDIKFSETRLQQVPANDDSLHTQKIRRTLEDNLKTCQDRLANYEKAQDNHELVGLEIDRLENKIRSLAELAVNRQDPEFISGQVDQVAHSMLETEKTMNDLQFATGLGPVEDAAPELVQAKQVQ